MVSQELNFVFNDAVTYVRKHRYEYITVDHVFLALLGNDQIAKILMFFLRIFNFVNRTLKYHFLDWTN